MNGGRARCPRSHQASARRRCPGTKPGRLQFRCCHVRRPGGHLAPRSTRPQLRCRAVPCASASEPGGDEPTQRPGSCPGWVSLPMATPNCAVPCRHRKKKATEQLRHETPARGAEHSSVPLSSRRQHGVDGVVQLARVRATSSCVLRYTASTVVVHCTGSCSMLAVAAEQCQLLHCVQGYPLHSRSMFPTHAASLYHLAFIRRYPTPSLIRIPVGQGQVLQCITVVMFGSMS